MQAEEHSQPQPHTVDRKTFAIGVLSITACILFVGFLLTPGAADPAYGVGQNDRAGDYLMATQQISDSQEAVIVIDAATGDLLMYIFDFNRKQLIRSNTRISLDRLPGARERLRGKGG